MKILGILLAIGAAAAIILAVWQGFRTAPAFPPLPAADNPLRVR